MKHVIVPMGIRVKRATTEKSCDDPLTMTAGRVTPVIASLAGPQHPVFSSTQRDQFSAPFVFKDDRTRVRRFSNALWAYGL